MRTSRDVALNIGKGIYTISTPLDNDALDRVKALINEACGEISKGTKQEDLLMLTCLRLAYSLDAVNEKLKTILERLEHD
ncbi:MAG: cell division protein ZapA [Synergistaceae bacterium]|nr:cell division protein ZapA [Synergistaceae bacterium]